MLEGKNKTKFIVYLALFGLMVLYLITTSIGDNSRTSNNDNNSSSNIDIVTLFDNIGSKYSISINELIDNVTYNLNITTDSNTYLYDGSLLGKGGYIYHNNKLFYVDDEFKLSKEENKYDFVNNPFSNLELIKNTIKYCEYSNKKTNTINCSIKLSDYIVEYNNLYNDIIGVSENSIITYKIRFNQKNITGINVDYSDINKLLNNSNSKIIYDISFEKFDEKSFEAIVNGYSDELNK